MSYKYAKYEGGEPTYFNASPRSGNEGAILSAWNWSVECYRNFMARTGGPGGVQRDLMLDSHRALRAFSNHGVAEPCIVAGGGAS